MRAVTEEGVEPLTVGILEMLEGVGEEFRESSLWLEDTEDVEPAISEDIESAFSEVTDSALSCDGSGGRDFFLGILEDRRGEFLEKELFNGEFLGEANLDSVGTGLGESIFVFELSVFGTLTGGVNPDGGKFGIPFGGKPVLGGVTWGVGKPEGGKPLARGDLLVDGGGDPDFWAVTEVLGGRMKDLLSEEDLVREELLGCKTCMFDVLLSQFNELGEGSGEAGRLCPFGSLGILDMADP